MTVASAGSGADAHAPAAWATCAGTRRFPPRPDTHSAMPSSRNLARATATIGAKRSRAVAELDDWQQLRAAGAAIKDDVLAHLEDYLLQLEQQVCARGGTVHWARDANEANRIVTGLVAATGATEVVKVKSMVTQEIGLNEALAAVGIGAVETDLAELIVQLGQDWPSHILVPAIHRNRTEIRDIFLREMPDVDPALTDDPAALAEPGVTCDASSSPRGWPIWSELRHRRNRDPGGRGVRGKRADVPDLAADSHHRDGDREDRSRLARHGGLPAVAAALVDRGTNEPLHLDVDRIRQRPGFPSCTPRQRTHGDPGRPARRFRVAVHPLLGVPNVCPVYQRTGGHAYGSVYPGPIGAVLTPQLTGVADNPTLPFASTLCGACFDACPVAIDIPAMLVHLRSRVVADKAARRRTPTAEAAAMTGLAWTMTSKRRWTWALRAARLGRVLRRNRISRLPPPLSA